MSHFEEIKANLKGKWLDYYQKNQSWIMIMRFWQSYPYAKRPNAKVMLGAILVLEPTLKPYLFPMLQIDKTGEDVIASLGLNFDPRDEIRKNPRQLASSPQAPIAFAEIKPLLREKWLAFFKENAEILDIFDLWININIDSGEKRPKADFILAAITAFEPSIKDYLVALCGVDKTGTKVIEALELNFDPRLELEKSDNVKDFAQEVKRTETSSIAALLANDPEYRAVHEGLEEIRAQIRQQENTSSS